MSELLSTRIILVKVKNQSREIFANDSVLKLNPWTYKINNLNGEKIIGNFLKKNCC